MALLLTAMVLLHGSAHAGRISRDLERRIASGGTHADTAVIVRLAEPVDLAALTVQDRRQRNGQLLRSMRAQTDRKLQALDDWLKAHQAERVRKLWIINGFSATLAAAAVRELAADPGVALIELDAYVQGGRTQRLPPARMAPPAASRGQAAPEPAQPVPPERAYGPPQWNIAALRAPEVWALGHRGDGAVVATMDSGVDLSHPELLRRWRGGSAGWFDPHGEQATPSDATGHGTQTLGVVLGGAEIGVAPRARWIAARLFDNQGRARMSDIHQAFQWLMDPDGDPDTVDAPDVVNASWSLIGRPPGSCIAEFDDDIRALKSAGIAVVFAAGNDGPAPRSSSSPANNRGALSVGAVDRDLAIVRQSSRGPSSCDDAVFPKLVAPGNSVRTSDLALGGESPYMQVSGSSIAAPHVAGVLALLAAAFPSASVADLEAALLKGARDLGEAGPDNNHGHGLVDALAAFKILQQAHRAVLPNPAEQAALARP
jgi:subtilisin family serine protease